MQSLDDSLGTSRAARIVPLVVFGLLLFALIYFLRATELSGNSLAYAVGAKTGESFHPSHLLHGSIIRMLFLASSGITPSDVIGAGQFHSIVWSVVTIFSIYLLLRRILTPFGALLVGVLILVTHDFWVFSTQLEVYVPMLGCLTALTAALFASDTPSLRIQRMIFCSGLWSLSVLYHQANVIFLLPLGFYLFTTQGKQAWKQLMSLCAVSGSVVLSCYVVVFWSIHPGEGIEEFIDWTIRLTQRPMTDWGIFAHWSPVDLTKAIKSQIASVLVVPEKFGLLNVHYVKAVALIIGISLVWNLLQVFRRAPHYQVRGFFLVWFVTYFLYFAWWDPRVHKFFLPSLIPLVVLGGMTVHDILVNARVPAVFKVITKSGVVFFLLVLFTSNLLSAILPLRESRGPTYDEAAKLNAIAPQNCTIYAYSELHELRYYFNRRDVKGVRDLFEEFYYVAVNQPPPIGTSSGLKNGSCTLLRLLNIRPKDFEWRTRGFMDSSKWFAFLEWFFDVKYEDESKHITYHPFQVVAPDEERAYVLVDRSHRVWAENVDVLFQSVIKTDKEYSGKFDLHTTDRDKRRHRIFGYY